ncbi:hypothetical protein [Pseudohaliea rubra]|uniref:VWA domain-containing protein n=1 Tax=Pseudohaliea rubra DSM 19751 TaxID=1265313 RepID=A0A095VWB8_9GAMM|nr:hypothetical protein [Pseudohaliea rubra]KGE05358.1 hypothetical protein HRUBRA_00038 [Pseudohaliea rubra DSM 19751]
MSRPPAKPAGAGEIARFLDKRRQLQVFAERSPRLLFAIDATASRQPTWDLACQLQGEMFLATERLASLSVQLCYYRGLGEFEATPWTSSASALARAMSRVHCAAGQTQLTRVLRHALAEHRRQPVRAVVFIGDAMEERAGRLAELAGECGLRQLPLFLFQEGGQPAVTACFEQLAGLSGGARLDFDRSSADRLASLLGAVACYAAGGREALENSASQGARLLLEKLKP